MKTQFVISIVIGLFMATSCNQESGYYVSTSGNDSDPGTREKPFATLQKAVEVVRSDLQSKQPSDITVYLHGGVYQLEEPVIFKPEDSGRDNFQVIYKAMPGEEPIMSGGVQVNNWEQNEQGVWISEVPQAEGMPWIFRELFIEGKRAQRARHPDQGYLRVAKVGNDNRTNFFFNRGDFPLPSFPGKLN